MQIIQAKQALTGAGWVRDVQIAIDDGGRIESVSAGRQVPTDVVDMLLPAPVNLHSHAFQRAMSGLTEARGPDTRDSFWTWRRLMYRFLDRLSPDDVQAITELVLMEMLEAGYAGVVEFHYLHHDIGGKPYASLAEMSDRIVAAALRTGIGLTLLPVLYQYGGCDHRPLTGGQQRFGNDIEQFQRLHAAAAKTVASAHPDYLLGAAPHSLRAVDQLGLNAAISAAGNGPVHMHLAEQVAEVEEVQANLGARPTEWLLGNHDVNRDWCLIHCTQMTSAETGALARSGAIAGLCPITESSLGDGIFNGTEFLADGGRIGFGSDSNVHIALFDELRTLEYSQRLRDRSRAALATADKSTGRVLFEQAAAGGAQAAGRSSGRIEEGCWADLVALSTDNHLVCNRQGDVALDTLIFGGHGQACVTDVWSAGRHVVKGHRHVAHDDIVRRFQDTIQKLGQGI